MSLSSQRPSLGSRPTAAEIANFNRWAARNGEQPLGQAQPSPARPPAPPPPPQGPPVAQQAPAYMNEDIWRRGTQIRDRTEFAVTKAGRVKMLRTWNARLKKWMWTDAGVHYYKHNRQRLIVNIPCLGYIPSTSVRAPSADLLAEKRAAAVHLLWPAPKLSGHSHHLRHPGGERDAAFPRC